MQVLMDIGMFIATFYYSIVLFKYAMPPVTSQTFSTNAAGKEINKHNRGNSDRLIIENGQL